MPYSLLVRSTLFLLLMGHLWVNVAAYSPWAWEGKTDPMELCQAECMDVETETNQENEFGEEKQLSIFFFESENETSEGSAFCSTCLFSLHHPETVTPPPELFHS